MSGTCLFKMEHSKCGSGDGLQIFENDDGTVSGFCFACHTYINSPLGDKPNLEDIPKDRKKSEEEIKAEMQEISELTSCDLVDRKLRAANLDFYGVKVGYDERDGKTPRLVFFPYTREGQIVRYKVRLLGQKKMWSVNLGGEVDMFGWDKAIGSGAKKIVITEGEYDAVALQRILQLYTSNEYKDNIPAVVSLPDGSSSVKKALTKALPSLKNYFNEVILALDQDEEGRKAVEQANSIIPDTRVMDLPCKDANEGLIKGIGKAVWRAVTFAANRPKNTRLVKGSQLTLDAMKRPEMGLSWPYEGLTKLTRGIRRGETY